MTTISQPLIVLIIFLCHHQNIITNALDGEWNLLLSNIGITAMHMQLLYTDKVVIYDRTDYGKSNISLPNGKCRTDHNNGRVDCTAHSVEYDVASNSVRPLMVETDTWCSSGGVLQDGTLRQTGGFQDGENVVRMYKPCTNSSCDWVEIANALAKRRWYATNHILPDGRMIVVGGRRQFNYEFVPKSSSMDTSYDLPFLRETWNYEENNLYPFVFLNGDDGNLFIFANNRAVLFNYKNSTMVKRYPIIPGGDPRNYPSTGSAVLLPLKIGYGPEVMICGGAPKGSFNMIKKKNVFMDALNTCGRIHINGMNPQWIMETMPIRRVMGDMVLLPNGKVLIINGASAGTAGWEFGRKPALHPVMYRPHNPIGSRFEVQNPSSRPRLYHSSALLLRDGRVLVGGNDPYRSYRFTGVLYPTDISLEAFSPFYLDSKFAHLRPTIVSPGGQTRIGYGQQIQIQFTFPPGILNETLVAVTMVAPSFATHSFSMNQRLLILTVVDVKPVAQSTYQVRVVSPLSGNLAPAGYYLLFVVYNDIPSEGIWVHLE